MRSLSTDAVRVGDAVSHRSCSRRTAWIAVTAYVWQHLTSSTGGSSSPRDKSVILFDSPPVHAALQNLNIYPAALTPRLEYGAIFYTISVSLSDLAADETWRSGTLLNDTLP